MDSAQSQKTVGSQESDVKAHSNAEDFSLRATLLHKIYLFFPNYSECISDSKVRDDKIT